MWENVFLDIKNDSSCGTDLEMILAFLFWLNYILSFIIYEGILL